MASTDETRRNLERAAQMGDPQAAALLPLRAPAPSLHLPRSRGARVMSWRDKAHKIIGEMCASAWRAANILPNGQQRKKHRPYSVPPDAAFLVACLQNKDERAAEHAAKAHFMRIADLQDMGANGV